MCRFFSPWFKSFDLLAMSCSAWRERRRLFESTFSREMNWRRAMTGVIRARIKTFSFLKKEIYQTCSSFTILLMMADWQTLSPPPLNSRMFYDSWLWSACCYFFRQQTGRPSLPFSFPPPAAKLNYSHHSLL
jgi:hypothetical protein